MVTENTEILTRYERLAQAALRAADRFDSSRDCSCHDKYAGTCWYHLPDEEQDRERLKFVAGMVEWEDEELDKTNETC